MAKGKEIARGIHANVLSEATLMIQLQQLVMKLSDGTNGSTIEN